MKLHTKYHMRFLWLCQVTGLADNQLRMFIASLLPGEQKRVGDYMFRLLSVRRAGKDVLYSVEVYFISSVGSKSSKTRLMLKSPILLYAPHRNNKRRVMR